MSGYGPPPHSGGPPQHSYPYPPQHPPQYNQPGPNHGIPPNPQMPPPHAMYPNPVLRHEGMLIIIHFDETNFWETELLKRIHPSDNYVGSIGSLEPRFQSSMTHSDWLMIHESEALGPNDVIIEKVYWVIAF